jgi:hypothetical protein
MSSKDIVFIVHSFRVHVLYASYLQHTNYSRNRVPKKLVVAQLLKRFACLCGTCNFIELCCEPREFTAYPVVFFQNFLP